MVKWFGLVVVMAMLASPGLAQSEMPSMPSASMPAPSASEAPAPDAAAVAAWQDVVHNQIQAFRDHDGVAALSYASSAFHELFKDPAEFMVAILNAGYAPIMESRSESFGPYEVMASDVVDQDVKFVGKDESLYEAIYRLQKEADGWRVEAVEMVKVAAVGA